MNFAEIIRHLNSSNHSRYCAGVTDISKPAMQSIMKNIFFRTNVPSFSRWLLNIYRNSRESDGKFPNQISNFVLSESATTRLLIESSKLFQFSALSSFIPTFNMVHINIDLKNNFSFFLSMRILWQSVLIIVVSRKGVSRSCNRNFTWLSKPLKIYRILSNWLHGRDKIMSSTYVLIKNKLKGRLKIILSKSSSMT